MDTSIEVRKALRDLRPFIDPPEYEKVIFSLGNFDLYVSGDEYAEGDEPFVLIGNLEILLNNLYNKNQLIPDQAPQLSKIDRLVKAADDYLGDLGYDWHYPVALI